MKLKPTYLDEFIPKRWEDLPNDLREHLLGKFGVGPRNPQPNPEYAVAEPAEPAIAKRRYVTAKDAERIARANFSMLRNLSNQSAWASIIGCNRKMVPKLPAWTDAKRYRTGVKKIRRELRGVVDPAILEALAQNDASALGRLTQQERDRIDAMPDDKRDELMALIRESAAEAV